VPGALGLILVYVDFLSKRELRDIKTRSERILGLNPYVILMAAVHALAFGAAIQLIYFLFPDPD
jgi:hypothetical protein